MPRLDELREEAAGCRACPLWKTGTQTVFGEGRAGAVAMFVGEQPGDQEDKTGRPFVGPAGRLLDEALEAAAIDRSTVYVTNAVKHFKWKARGKRRKERGTWVESDLADFVTATIHPSAILRQRSDEERHAETARFVDDLVRVARVLGA